MMKRPGILQGIASVIAFIVYLNIADGSGIGDVPNYLIGTVVATLVYWGVGRMLGNQTTKKNQPPQQHSNIDYQKVVGVPYAEFYQAITEGYGYVHSLQRSSLSIQHVEVKAHILLLCAKSSELFKSIEQKPVRLSVIKRMSSYLQEASELIREYEGILNTNVSSPDIEQGIQRLESFIQNLTETIEAQIIDLQEDKIQNLTMRIQALEDVMKIERQ
jgi:5-bromo-4-chloroindolyl phosphate hydrolysis protein